MSCNIPGLIGMDILDSKYRDRSIFHLDLSDRQLTVDNVNIGLLGGRQCHLCLPDNFIKISSKFRRTKSSSNKMSENNATFYQDEHVLCTGRADKGKLKATLPDIQTPDDNNRKLTKKEYNRPDVIAAKKTELEKFFKFNVIKSIPHAPWGAEVMWTMWVINEKNLSKTGSKIKARLCTMDSVQFESPT